MFPSSSSHFSSFYGCLLFFNSITQWCPKLACYSHCFTENALGEVTFQLLNSEKIFSPSLAQYLCTILHYSSISSWNCPSTFPPPRHQTLLILSYLSGLSFSLSLVFPSKTLRWGMGGGRMQVVYLGSDPRKCKQGNGESEIGQETSQWKAC